MQSFNSEPSINASVTQNYYLKRGLRIIISKIIIGIMFVDGEVWHEQRRFTMRHLRDLGFGKTSIESQMMDEVRLNGWHPEEHFTDGVVHFKEGIFNVSVMNVLWAIMGGERFRRDDGRFLHLMNAVELFFRSGNVLWSSIPVPWFFVRNVPMIASFLGTSTEAVLPLQQFILVLLNYIIQKF